MVETEMVVVVVVVEVRAVQVLAEVRAPANLHQSPVQR
jgi:hypothetical protein